MTATEAEVLVRAKMAEHGLVGWRFVWGRGKNRCGVCRYRSKEIGLSIYHVRLNGVEHVSDTILHEIAHALAGPGTHHGPVWKEMCIKVGARPERLASEEVRMCQDYKHHYKCIQCGYIFNRHKRLAHLEHRFHAKCGKSGKLVETKELEEIK